MTEYMTRLCIDQMYTQTIEKFIPLYQEETDWCCDTDTQPCLRKQVLDLLAFSRQTTSTNTFLNDSRIGVEICVKQTHEQDRFFVFSSVSQTVCAFLLPYSNHSTHHVTYVGNANNVPILQATNSTVSSPLLEHVNAFWSLLYVFLDQCTPETIEQPIGINRVTLDIMEPSIDTLFDQVSSN
jgi:hypothetical protein